MMKAVTDSRATNKRGSPTARNGSWQNITAAEQSNPHISKEGSHVFHGYAESPVQHQSQFIRQRKSGMRPRAFSEMEADSQVVSFIRMTSHFKSTCVLVLKVGCNT